MNIGQILSRAWKIIWKHKILWVFGILASCGQTGGSSGGGSSGGSNGSQSLYLPLQKLSDIGNWDFLFILLLIAGGVLFIFLMIALVVTLNAIGRIGLVRGVQKAEAGQERLSFGELLAEVKPFFWRVAGLNLLVGVIIFAMVMAIILVFGIVAIATLGLGLLCLFPMLFLLLPIMWAVVVIVEQANVALIVEDISIPEALKRSWQVVFAHPANYLVMGLILILGVGLLGMLVIGLPFLLVMVPFILGLIISEGASTEAGMILSLLCCTAYLPVMILLAGILRSYIITSWTLTYLQLAGPAQKVPVEAPEVEPAPLEESTPPPVRQIL